MGAGAIVLATELRIVTALLKEDSHNLEGILRQGLLCAEGPWREQQDIKVGGKDVRDKWRIHTRLGRREVALDLAAYLATILVGLFTLRG